MLQKKYEDYLKELHKLFPDVEEDSIKNIIEFGLKKIYNCAKEGSDVLLRDHSTYTFIGGVSQESAQQWHQSKLKEHSKYRRMFLDKKEVWDGYHYFGLTEEENNEFKINPHTVTLYKLEKECSIRKSIVYIYRINLDYKIPHNKISWKEDKILSIKQCELYEEGVARLKAIRKKSTSNLKYKIKYEEDNTE